MANETQSTGGFSGSGGGGGGVTSIIAGTNITISPIGGTGAVTINSSSGAITVVANYSALPAVATVTGQFFWASASQGTKWLPGAFGGTYYSAGMYYSNGISYEFTDVPYQATQAEVNTGTNTDKFVTPATLAAATTVIPKTGTTGDLISFSATDTPSHIIDVTAGSYLRSGGIATLPVWSTLTLPNTATTGDLLQATSSNVVSILNSVATGNALISGGVATASSWGKIGLTTHVSGILPGANGGTGVANTGFAITIAGNLITTGAFNTTFAASATATYTLPTATSTLLANSLGLSGGTTLIGGTATTDKLTFRTTSNSGGTTGADFIWQSGNNGATDLMRLLNAGSLVIGATAVIGTISTTLLSMQKSSTGGVGFEVYNNNGGTGAFSGFIINNGTSNFAMYQAGSGYTTSGQYVQNGSTFESSGAGGMSISVLNAGSLRIYSAATLRSTISSAGLVTWTSAYHILSIGTATANTYPLKFTLPGVPLTVRVAGVMETDAERLYYTPTSTARQVFSGVLFTQTADKTVTNTVTETSIIGTGVGSLATAMTLPANFFVAGKAIRVRIGGIYSTPIGVASLIIKVKYGATTIATITTTSLLSAASNLEFDGEVLITCRTTGATGTVVVHGDIEYSTGITGTIAVDPLNNAGAATTIDTTASSLIDVTVQWDTNTTTRIATSTTTTMEVLN